MHHRVLGKSGLRLAEVGYGAWGIGNSSWLGADDADSMRALHRAMDLGVNFIDTALVYGDGASERLVGTAVRSPRNVERNCALADGRPLSAAQPAILAQHRWVRNFYQ
ncbi:aldo/keto reductase [Rugamonas sp. DEMB1]|uniref:aldo/keto reductase n=1 Tax=Rugamonas sp. DEMB1 TaxID=3039386 RepID=UPI00244D1FF8|nr:aldo/keto reductase [Rugamonas sp. DEMB1]WGG48246.1 aldo/keto reductase [Rugamonas sp. DEMB1]